MKLTIVLTAIIMHLLFTNPVSGQATAGADNKSAAELFAAYDSLIRKYYFTNIDSNLFFALKAVDLAKSLNDITRETTYLNNAGEAYRGIGEFPASLEMQFMALDNNIKMKNRFGEAITLSFIGFTYTEFKESRTAIPYFQQAERIIDSIRGARKSEGNTGDNANNSLNTFGCFNMSNMGYAYDRLDMLDSALYFQEYAQTKFTGVFNGPLKSLILTRLGNIYAKLGKNDEALHYYYASMHNAYQVQDQVNPSKIKNLISETYQAQGKFDSSLLYARLALQNSRSSSQKLEILNSANQLVRLFRKNNIADSIIFYQDISLAMKDSLFGPEKIKQLQLLKIREQQKQQDLLREKEQIENRARILILTAILAFLLFAALLLYRNNRHKQNANLLLQEQKREIQETLDKLTATQKQLVQSEKMASLGELTAGVAHEIQNPLNFVNNFSELNIELLEDLKDATQKEDLKEVDKLSDQLKENESKINYHGKRADAIVKNMLQHSRNGSAVKEPTDINKLTDEYVRLSFHGMRAKDKTFNAELDLQYDPAIGKTNIIPQDIGRVLLNILNNAFYAVNEKQKSGLPDYHPKITVQTILKDINDNSLRPPGKSVEITITDNGPGIPQHLEEKIFQPFFTTKPTGEGTGLGLSLSYDIITKGHSGILKINSVPGEFTTFIIELPA